MKIKPNWATMKETDKLVDPQLWHACAGSMVQIPPLNSLVFYFPQGHAEHSLATVDFSAFSQILPLILCRVSAVKFCADSETDEVHAKLTLLPLPNRELDLEEDAVKSNGSDSGVEKPSSFAKTLTQSDANNGGGFSVPRYCAETIFPRLDCTADPPVQTVVAKDVHGEVWNFRHIYRGTPRRHLLTTGWSTFVNQKKLVAGDSIVFLRAGSGELCVGVRRAKRGMETEKWGLGPLGSTGNLRVRDGRVTQEEVLGAVARAINARPFEVVYYPRASTPEFCVKAAAVRAAMRIHWCAGMRFKMPFETEDSSRISWFMGTVSSVQVADPIRWPNSPWRILKVTWDEPDLLQNVKHVSPWLVELVSNMPVNHISPFSPPRKKLRLPQHLDFPPDGQFSMPSLTGSNPFPPSSPLRCLSGNAPAGIQGARHFRFGKSLSDLHLSSKLQSGLFLSSLQRFNPHSRNSDGVTTSQTNSSENVSCLLTIGISNHKEKTDNVRRHQFFLFGQPILTEQQISRSCSGEVVSLPLSRKSSLEKNLDKANDSSDGLGLTFEPQVLPDKKSNSGLLWYQNCQTMEPALDIGHCKVFMESEDVGRTLDLAVVGSYEELYRKLANMFGIDRSDMLSHVLYQDATGAVKQIGDEPFSEFMKSAKRLTIRRMHAGNDNLGRSWLRGTWNAAESRLHGPNKNGPLSIFA